MSQMVPVPFGNVRVNRLLPAAGPQHYKTYSMRMPLGSHWRPATCEEAGCEAYRCGWASMFDVSTELGQRQYEFCSADRERSFHIQRPAASLVTFVYAPGNRCFRSGDHRVPLERPAVFAVAEGDWRGNPRGIPVRVHKRAADWVEDFAEHQDRVATAIQRG